MATLKTVGTIALLAVGLTTAGCVSPTPVPPISSASVSSTAIVTPSPTPSDQPCNSPTLTQAVIDGPTWTFTAVIQRTYYDPNGHGFSESTTEAPATRGVVWQSSPAWLDDAAVHAVLAAQTPDALLSDNFTGLNDLQSIEITPPIGKQYVFYYAIPVQHSSLQVTCSDRRTVTGALTSWGLVNSGVLDCALPMSSPRPPIDLAKQRYCAF